MRPGLHQGAHSTPGVRPARVDVDDVLHHDVVEQETADGAVTSVDEALLEAAVVESFYAFFSSISCSEEFDVSIWVICVHVHDLDSYL